MKIIIGNNILKFKKKIVIRIVVEKKLGQINIKTVKLVNFKVRNSNKQECSFSTNEINLPVKNQ